MKEIDALKVGDKLEVEFDPGVWVEIVLAERTPPMKNKEDKRTHLQVLIDQYGYKRIRPK